MLTAGLNLPPSAAAHTRHAKHRFRAAAAARRLPIRARATGTTFKAIATMESAATDAELDSLVQDAIVWASQHGLVSAAAATVQRRDNSSVLQLKRNSSTSHRLHLALLMNVPDSQVWAPHNCSAAMYTDS